MKILAIDQSTTSTTAFLFDRTGQGTVLLTRFHKQSYPHKGWVEHDPSELLSHVTDCIAAGRAAGAQAVALSNQGESCLAWDAETGTPVSPVLVWQDARAEPLCDALATTQGATVERLARLPLDAYFSAPKMSWILRNIPEAAALAETGTLRLGTTDAFFRDRLGGRFETDVATASRTCLLNMDSGNWDPGLCEIFGLPLDSLPAITDCSGDLGTFGGLPLASAIVDQQAALFGHGVAAAGDTKITFGTGAFALTLFGTDCPPLAHGVLPTVGWREAGAPTQFALDAGIHTASAAINWARGLGLFDSFDELNTFDGHALARGLAFVPALTGLGCPHWDHGAKGTWLGLDLGTSKRDMMQAVLEGIAYRSRELLDAIARNQPLSDPIRIDGGMTRNPWFCQALANITGQRVQVAPIADVTAFGVAQLAARHLGAALSLPEGTRTYAPEADFTPLPEIFTQAREMSRSWGQVSSKA